MEFHRLRRFFTHFLALFILVSIYIITERIRINATYKHLTDSVFKHEARKFCVRAPENVCTKLRVKSAQQAHQIPLDFPLM
jgi:hypothetical protein